MKTSHNIILGIDPGYDRLGVAVISNFQNKPVLIFSDCLTSNKKQSHEKRLCSIGRGVKSIIAKWKPSSVAIEEIFFSNNRKTALRVSQALGVVVYEAAQANIPVSYYTPTQVKIAITGYGRSDKKQITDMLKHLINTPNKKIFDDEYDAIALGLTHLAHFPSKN